MWFLAMWWVCTQKTGGSAKDLQKFLGLGSYQTAWSWLHKLRRAMINADREPLNGTVEIDDAFIGGKEEGVVGRETFKKVKIIVHLSISLLKRWILGTHHGAVRPKHIQHYLDEFVFRHNRRTSKYVGKIFYRMLQGTIKMKATPYWQLVGREKPDKPLHVVYT